MAQFNPKNTRSSWFERRGLTPNLVEAPYIGQPEVEQAKDRLFYVGLFYSNFYTCQNWNGDSQLNPSELLHTVSRD